MAFKVPAISVFGFVASLFMVLVGEVKEGNGELVVKVIVGAVLIGLIAYIKS